MNNLAKYMCARCLLKVLGICEFLKKSCFSNTKMEIFKYSGGNADSDVRRTKH